MTKVRTRVLGLAVVAALTATAFTASSALALPEWGNCIVQAQHEGKYTDSNCTSKAKKVNEKFTGEFEFVHTPGQEFNSALSPEGQAGPVVYESHFHYCVPSEENLPTCREGETEEVVPLTVECTGHDLLGFISRTNAKAVEATKYNAFECTTLGSSLPCANNGNFIETNYLRGTLGYINKATKEVGLELKPETGKTFFKADCGGVLSITVGEATEKEGPVYPPKGGGDGAIGVVTPVNEMTDEWEVSLTANGETAQNIPSHFEGKGLALLEDYATNLTVTGKGSKWSPAAMAGHAAMRECASKPECLKYEVKA